MIPAFPVSMLNPPTVDFKMGIFKNIPRWWLTRSYQVIVGMLCQFIVALFVLRTKAGYDIFNFISELCRELLGFANQGVIFLTDDTVPKLPWFFTGVVPPIIFFVSFVQLLYHW